ncbi:uncharacterized protein LOC132556745 [Ylistrum balloti]|uniref:uncharacterized protein LOC132556745 n=1 Tax=Ylistrum balloti TaxID=509963 RepID=UPI0029058776|nr:uncharacterized protein LOC132556745 [Ylistrum balloti]
MVYSSCHVRMPISLKVCSLVSTTFGIMICTFLIHFEYFKPVWKHNHSRLQDSTLLSVFSAVVHIEDESQITLNVWDGSKDKSYKCCILISKEQLIQVFAKPLNGEYKENLISARQYRCSLSSIQKLLISVAMIPASKKCAMTEQFTNVIYPPKQRTPNRFVIYSVVTQDVSPMQLIEWLEYYKSTGVENIYLVLQLPDAQVMTVLSYYMRNGFLDIQEFPFPLPGRSHDDVDRSFFTTTNDSVRYQLDQDKRVALFHCMEYLRGFGYAANIDVNEFILPQEWKMMFYFLEDTFEKNYPDAAGVKMKRVQSTNYQANPQGKNDSDNIKYSIIHIPGRVLTTSSDMIIPQKNYVVYTLPDDKGVVHYVKHCAAMWIICIKNRSSSTLKLYHSRSELERKCLTIAAKLYLSAYNTKRRYICLTFMSHAETEIIKIMLNICNM